MLPYVAWSEAGTGKVTKLTPLDTLPLSPMLEPLPTPRLPSVCESLVADRAPNEMPCDDAGMPVTVSNRLFSSATVMDGEAFSVITEPCVACSAGGSATATT